MQQHEIDGLCSQMCSASPRSLCVCLSMCVFMICEMDGDKKSEERGERKLEARGNQLCFCGVYIINALLNRTVSTQSISLDHKYKYCQEDKRGKLSKCLVMG